MNNIVKYKEHSLEIITSKDLITPNTLKQHLPRFYLAGNLYVGLFNQAGFVIVDTTPELRPDWIGSDIMARSYTPKEVQKMINFGQIKEEERYFYDATGGLAALRFFAVSKELTDIFERDTFLGTPMIRKICEQEIVPEMFHELQVTPDHRQPIYEYASSPRELQHQLGQVVDLILQPLKQRTGTEYTYFPYVTYFPTQAYGMVTQTLEESVQEAVARFDEFGNKFKLSEAYKELKTNPLLLKPSQ